MANLNTIYMMMDEKKAVCLVKVGFTKELDVRLQAYKAHNPLAECVSIQKTQERSGRAVERAYFEELKHRGFNSVGLPPTRGRASEWFIIPYDNEFYKELKEKGLDAFKCARGRKTYNLKAE